MKKIKVVEVVSGINGGVGMLLYNYLSRFDLNKYEINIIAQDVPNHSFKERIEKLGIKTYIIPTKKQNLVLHFKEMYKIFKNNKYDIAHFHMSTSNCYGLLVAKIVGIKNRISHSHSCESSNKITSKIIHKILNYIGRIFATDYYSCGLEAGAYLFGKRNIKKGKVKIINNAIDISHFKFDEDIREEYRRKLGIENKNCIGIVGRMEYQKNYFGAIEIFKKLHELCHDTCFIIIGDGKQKEELKEYVHKLRLEDAIIFLGKKNDVYNWYMAMDLFLLPSRYEGLPIVLIETQVSGLKALVSTNITQEMCETDLIKFLDIKKDKVEIWAKKINNMIGEKKIDRNKYYEIMKNSKYNIEKEYFQLEKEYSDLIYRTKERGK